MKTINKIKIILQVAAVVLLVTSCEKDVLRDPSPEVNPNSNKVYFPEQNKSSLILGISDPSFDVKISRKNSTAALTVNLKSYGKDADKFTVPASVTFNAGDADTIVTIGVGDIDLLITQSLTIELIDKDQSDPYSKDAGYDIISLSILKEDFEDVGIGQWTDGIVCAIFSVPVTTYDVQVQFSPSMKMYRLVNPYGFGVYSYTEEADMVRDLTYLLINVQDPEKVTISGTVVGKGFGLGIDFGYGEFLIGIPSSGGPGTLIDKTIVFPAGKSLAVGMYDETSGGFGWMCKECKLILP